MTDGQGRDLVWSIVQDISRRKALESELKAAAQRDKLTGLANRALFMERLQRAIERVRNNPDERFTVLFLDFDHFKRLNDTLGHAAGDDLLTQIARRLRSALRAADAHNEHVDSNLIARFGGDEFVVLLNDVNAGADVAKVSDRLLDSLAPAYSIGGRDVHSTASIGIVTSDQCTESAEAVIRNADVAMYEAKRRGRACSVIFNDGMHTRLARQVAVENGLRKALASDEMFLVYQPIVRSQDRTHDFGGRCCAGSIRNSASFRRRSSSPSPRNRVSSCRSANGSCRRAAVSSSSGSATPRIARRKR